MVTLAVCLGGWVRAGTATNIFGLYYTGTDSSGALLAGGAADLNWTVTHASSNGGSSTNNTHMGSADVVSDTYIDAGWTQNTSSSKRIVAPGARTAATGGTVNVGGDFLPGNGERGGDPPSLGLLRFAGENPLHDLGVVTEPPRVHPLLGHAIGMVAGPVWVAPEPRDTDENEEPTADENGATQGRMVLPSFDDVPPQFARIE